MPVRPISILCCACLATGCLSTTSLTRRLTRGVSRQALGIEDVQSDAIGSSSKIAISVGSTGDALLDEEGRGGTVARQTKTSVVCVTNVDGRFCGSLSSESLLSQPQKHSVDHEPTDEENPEEEEPQQEEELEKGIGDHIISHIQKEASQLSDTQLGSIQGYDTNSSIQGLQGRAGKGEGRAGKGETSTQTRTNDIIKMEGDTFEPEIDYMTSCRFCSGCSECGLPPNPVENYSFPQGSLACTPSVGCLEFWDTQNGTYDAFLEECAGKAATCGGQDCVECSGCLHAVVRSPMCAEEILNEKKTNGTCLDMDKMSSCAFSMRKCSDSSPMCLNQLLCREPCVCEEWKRKHCIGLDVGTKDGRACNLTQALAPRSASQKLAQEVKAQDVQKQAAKTKVNKWHSGENVKWKKDKNEWQGGGNGGRGQDDRRRKSKGRKGRKGSKGKKGKRRSLIDRSSHQLDRRSQGDATMTATNGLDFDASVQSKCGQ